MTAFIVGSFHDQIIVLQEQSRAFILQQCKLMRERVFVSLGILQSKKSRMKIFVVNVILQ